MIQENQKFAFLVDVSGSTGNSENYWTTVKQIFEQYSSQVGHYYEWDSDVTEVSKKEMQHQIASKTGKGGTSPENVASLIIKNKHKKIILITDGQVSDHSVQQCDKYLQGYVFQKSICYIIASCSYGRLNMSVTCPFTRNCDNEVYQKKKGAEMKKLVQYSAEDYKMLEGLGEITLQSFQANYEKIEGLIIALNMGKSGNIKLKDEIILMKNKLLKQIANKASDKNINLELRKNLQEGKLNEALKLASDLTNKYFDNNISLSVEQKINHLIQLCGDLRGKYDLGQIKSNKMARAADAKEAKIDESIDPNKLSSNLIECPIIMDQDVPQILIDQCQQPIFAGVEKAVLSDITACPLRLLNYPQIKAKLKSRLSNFIGVKYTNKFMKNPFTQKRLLGSIPLGCHMNHVELGNYTIAKMFSQGKILGNLNLFYATIWYIIKESEIQYLKQIEVNASQHLAFRLKNCKTMASLCGLTKLVNTKLPSDVAVWYCAHSGLFNQPLDRNTFRFHTFDMFALIDILKSLKYPIQDRVERHYLRTKCLVRLFEAYKKLSPENKKSFKESIKCLYQNSIEIDINNVNKQVRQKETIVRLVPVDGEATAKQVQKILKLLPLDLQKLSIQQIVHIGSLLDQQKVASQIAIDYDFNPNPIPKSQINWSYGLAKPQQKQLNSQSFKLCPQTYRLLSIQNNSLWEDLVQKHSQIPNKSQFRARHYFLQFLKKYQKIPTNDQLILFYYNRVVVGKKATTLPYMSELWAKLLIQNYSRLMEENKIPVKGAIDIMKKATHMASKANQKKL